MSRTNILGVFKVSNMKLAKIIGSNACPLDRNTPSRKCAALCLTILSSA